MSEELTQLNKQAIAAARNYMGEFAWPTVLLVAVVVTGFIGNLVLYVQGLLPLWLAILVYAVLTYMSYTPLHEAAHQNIHGRYERFKWVNDLCGYLVAPIIAVPYASHTVEHFTHHRYTNQPDKDPDHVVSGMGGGLIPFITHGVRFLWMQNSFLFRDYWATASRRERTIYLSEIGFSIGWRLLLLAAVATPGMAALLLLGYFGGAFFTAYWFAYRPHLPYADAARYRNTNSLIMPRWMKPLEWFWLGQNLHSIHHLFPRVPFYRYHALHREIEPAMRAHGAPIVGLFSREPVPPQARPVV